MAYFGDRPTARPWGSIDIRFMALFALSFGGIVTSIIIARNLTTSDANATEHRTSEPGAVSNDGQRTSPIIPMVIATADIPAGTRLSPALFRLEPRSNEGLGNEALQDLSEIEGIYSRAMIAANTPVLRSALTRSQPPGDIVHRIPSGYRAVAIPVNALTGVEGWVRPGATVDVVWSTTRGDDTAVSTIVENARVLSVERSLDTEVAAKTGAPSMPNHVTLLATTGDAQKIQLAKTAGSLSLSLRGAEDITTTGSSILTSDVLLSRTDPRARIKGSVTIDGKEFVLLDNRLVETQKAGLEAR